MIITRRSPFSGKENTMDIPHLTVEDLENYQTKGYLIQVALRHLSASEREFVMTGITPDEWEDFLGTEE